MVSLALLGDPPAIGSPGHHAYHYAINRWTDTVVVPDRPTGDADGDTDNILAAIAEAEARGPEAGVPAPIVFIPGDYYVNQNLSVQSTRPFVYGNGSIFHWRGAPGGDMWDLEHARDGLFDHMECRFDNAYPARSAFRWYRSNAPGMILSPTRMKWSNVKVYGYSGAVDYGWYLGHPDPFPEGTDANVDQGVWRDCVTQYCGIAGWRLALTQGYAHEFYDCHAAGYGVADCAVHAYYAMFHWNGGTVFSHADADFIIEGWGQAPLSIRRVVGENSDRFIRLKDSVRPFINIEDCSFAGDDMNADGKFFVCENTTSAVISVRQLKAGKSATTQPVQFDFGGVASNGHIELHGVHIDSAAAPNPPWGARTPDKSTGVAIVNPALSESIAITKVTDI